MFQDSILHPKIFLQLHTPLQDHPGKSLCLFPKTWWCNNRRHWCKTCSSPLGLIRRTAQWHQWGNHEIADLHYQNTWKISSNHFRDGPSWQECHHLCFLSDRTPWWKKRKPAATILSPSNGSHRRRLKDGISSNFVDGWLVQFRYATFTRSPISECHITDHTFLKNLINDWAIFTIRNTVKKLLQSVWILKRLFRCLWFFYLIFLHRLLVLCNFTSQR